MMKPDYQCIVNVSPLQASVYFLLFFVIGIQQRSYCHLFAFVNKLLSAVYPRYFIAYIHFDVIIKSLELSTMWTFRVA
jgi:hypothetical protein